MTSLAQRISVRVSETPLDSMSALRAVEADSAGASVLFTGIVRNHDHGRTVSGLSYSAHPSAEQVLESVVATILADHPDVISVFAHHRVGELAIGDLALVASVSSAHRAAAFTACEDLVELIKARVPIWKHQVFADGTTEWVNSP
jgi:molybdopterin synthase catalytic subunit